MKDKSNASHGRGALYCTAPKRAGKWKQKPKQRRNTKARATAGLAQSHRKLLPSIIDNPHIPADEATLQANEQERLRHYDFMRQQRMNQWANR